jgi:Kef-type K+ transport system membrane component KefB
MLVLSNVFNEIAVLMAIACFFGGLALWFRQPLIIAFIIVGIVVGPAGLGLINISEEVEFLAELGIALLLFVVGLKLNPHEIRSVGFVVIVTALGQIFFTGLLGFLLALLLGKSLISAFYIGICLTFSSTIIIIKILSDQKEIDALHSRIAVGVLIIQDIVVILVMIALTAFVGDNQEKNLIYTLAFVLIKGSGFLLIITLFTRYVLPKILNSLAKSVELLIIFAITWVLSLASVGDILGFGKEVGAFLAGVALASTHYRFTIAIRLVTLRDFLLLFFFINLGIHIDVTHIQSEIFPALILSLFVLIGKPLIILTIIGGMGYRKYTATLTSLFLSQISEFSLILVTFGVSLQQIPESVRGLITLVGLITMGLSTYMIVYCHQIYGYLSRYVEIFQRKIKHPEETLGVLDQNNLEQIDVILFGLGRYGGSLIKYLQQEGMMIVGVDFNPEIIKFWHQRDVITLYGDVENPEVTTMLPLDKTSWIVSTIPGIDLGLNLIQVLKKNHFQGKIALTSHTKREMDRLYQAGADLVLLPFKDAAKEAAETLGEQIKNGSVVESI